MLSSKVGALATESHPMASGCREDPKRQIKRRHELAHGRVIYTLSSTTRRRASAGRAISL